MMQSILKPAHFKQLAMAHLIMLTGLDICGINYFYFYCLWKEKDRNEEAKFWSKLHLLNQGGVESAAM